MSGRWSEVNAEHEIRYTGDERFCVIMMSKTAGVAERLYRLVVRVSGSNIRVLVGKIT
jgi:hypothetical protein